MIQLRPLLFIVGLFLVALGVLMLVPALLMMLRQEGHWNAFMLAAAVTAFCGAVAVVFNRQSEFSLSTRQDFVLTTLVWCSVSAFAALPLMFVEHIGFTDAFFETMSGITTTGATVLSGLEHHASGILLWRSLLQWAGGIGFIVMGVAILPFLRVGGMRLFQSESSDWSEKAFPRFASVARAIAAIYLGLTVLGFLAYRMAGMDDFDALNHIMTTISTGGYSTYDDSMGHFPQPAIHWVSVLFMLLGGLPFTLYIHALRGRPGLLWRDAQVRGFLGFVAFISLVLIAWLWLRGDEGLGVIATRVVFNVVSVITTTGYVSHDYQSWGPFAAVVFFYLMFVGACSGSTTGSIKVFRFQVAWMLLRAQLHRLVHPTAVIRERYNGREIGDDVIRSIVAFSFFFGLTIGLLALGLAMQGLDFVTSLTAAVTSVTNVGPGLGDVVGPTGNFASLPDASKWMLSAGMLLGRLEIMTVVVLFTPTFWKG